MWEGQALPHDTKIVTVGAKLWTEERFVVDPWSKDQADLVWWKQSQGDMPYWPVVITIAKGYLKTAPSV